MHRVISNELFWWCSYSTLLQNKGDFVHCTRSHSLRLLEASPSTRGFSLCVLLWIRMLWRETGCQLRHSPCKHHHALAGAANHHQPQPPVASGRLELCLLLPEEAGRVDEDINNDYLVISNNTIAHKKYWIWRGYTTASEKPLCQMSLHPQLQCTGFIHVLHQTAKRLQCYKGALITHHSNNFQLCTDTVNHSPTKQHVEGSFPAQVRCWMGGTFHPINIWATSNELIVGQESPLVCQSLLQRDRQWEWVCWYAPGISGTNPSLVPRHPRMWAQAAGGESLTNHLWECGRCSESKQRQQDNISITEIW